MRPAMPQMLGRAQIRRSMNAVWKNAEDGARGPQAARQTCLGDRSVEKCGEKRGLCFEMRQVFQPVACSDIQQRCVAGEKSETNQKKNLRLVFEQIL